MRTIGYSRTIRIGVISYFHPPSHDNHRQIKVQLHIYFLNLAFSLYGKSMFCHPFRSYGYEAIAYVRTPEACYKLCKHAKLFNLAKDGACGCYNIVNQDGGCSTATDSEWDLYKVIHN